jgi:hypothetical protein
MKKSILMQKRLHRNCLAEGALYSK